MKLTLSPDEYRSISYYATSSLGDAMKQQFRLDCPTISNIPVTGKMPSPWGFWLAAWLMVAFFGGSGVAWSLPVPIAWDVPLERGETYDLEIADSPGFSKTLLHAAVKGTGYMWAGRIFLF